MKEGWEVQCSGMEESCGELVDSIALLIRLAAAVLASAKLITRIPINGITKWRRRSLARRTCQRSLMILR